jgi:hypothetical protein
MNDSGDQTRDKVTKSRRKEMGRFDTGTVGAGVIVVIIGIVNLLAGAPGDMGILFIAPGIAILIRSFRPPVSFLEIIFIFFGTVLTYIFGFARLITLLSLLSEGRSVNAEALAEICRQLVLLTLGILMLRSGFKRSIDTSHVSGLTVIVGFIMVTIGFIIAALATVVDENYVIWLLYIPALYVGVAGVSAIRINDARQNKTEHHVAAKIETVDSSLERIATNIEKLNAEKQSINTYDMRHRIDELFIDDLELFVDARQSIAHRYGLAAYGEIMSGFAAGERYLNRVWSASADGYIDEVNIYLDKARKQFSESLKKLRDLAVEGL